MEKTVKKNGIKVAVGLSGGVDSAVSAYLLKEQGYDVTGVYMQCWEEKADGCRANEDRKDAVRVAYNLEIPFKALDFIKEYNQKVIELFYKEYEAGRTPNPDVLCNKEIKFGMFLNWALDNGFEYVATGHYAGVREDNGSYKLLKGKDTGKDQSYFLYLLNQDQLSKTIFPLGEMEKRDVRKLAKEIKLPVSDKPDSVGICFIGEVDIREFLKRRIEENPGNVVNSGGDILGKHVGLPFYTIGQRHGFEIDKYVGLPLYVIGKNMNRNELVVGFAKEANREEFLVKDLHWISGTQSELPLKCEVRIRHLGELFFAELVAKTLSNPETNRNEMRSGTEVDKVEAGIVRVALSDPIFGVAPGQSAVFYKDDDVLGGGVIA